MSDFSQENITQWWKTIMYQNDKSLKLQCLETKIEENVEKKLYSSKKKKKICMNQIKTIMTLLFKTQDNVSKKKNADKFS
jgi:hypothetical protein